MTLLDKTAGARRPQRAPRRAGRCKAALIGAGRMGRSHAAALGDLGVSLACICDPRAAARDAVAQEFGVAAELRYAEAADLFAANGDLDLVVIATTADSHADLVQAAAAAGARRILCEKPLATSIADCDAAIDACTRSGALLAVNHQMRFMEQYLIVDRILKSGALGRLASMTVVGGSFGLANNGSHYMEAFAFLTGGKIIEANAWFSGEPIANPRGPAFFDRAGEFRLVADTGQRLMLVIGSDQGHGMTAMYAGRYGHVFVDELEGEVTVSTRKAEHRGEPTTRYSMAWDHERKTIAPADNVHPTRAVLEALLAGTGYPTGEDGRRVIAALAACYASGEADGRVVRIDEAERLRDRRFPWA